MTAAVRSVPDLSALVRAFAHVVQAHYRGDRADARGSVAAQLGPDGSLRLVLVDPPDEARVLTLLAATPPDARALPVGPFGWVAADAIERAGTPAWDALVAACHQLARDRRFDAFQVARADLDPPWGEPCTLARLLARRLTAGQTRCCGYRFLRAEAEPGRAYSLVFARPEAESTVTFRVCTKAAEEQVSWTSLGGFELGVLVDGPDGRRELHPDTDVATLPATQRGLVELVRFVLLRSLPPWPGPSGADRSTRSPGTSDADALDQEAPAQTSTMTTATAWRRFFVPFEAERDLICGFPSTDAWGRTIFFLHGELECLHIQPQGALRAAFQRPLRPPKGPRDPDVEDPAIRALLAELLATAAPEAPTPRPEAAHAPDDLDTAPYVLMGDEEVILGATDKLEDGLRLQRDHAREGDLLIFNETCVSRLMGEDLQRAKRHHLAEGGAPILELDIALPGPLAILTNMIEQLKAIVLARTSVDAAGGVLDDGVALVGYPSDGSEAEIGALLGSLGLRLTTAFLPELGRESLLLAMRSRFLLCNPGPGWREIAENVVAGSHSRLLTPALPYGFAGTRRFLDEVAAGVGTPAMPEARRRLEAVVAELRYPLPRELGVGWILDRSEAERLVKACGAFGVPALPFLEDLGFRQTVFLHVAEPPGALAEVGAMLEAALCKPASVTVRPFAGRDDLLRLLREAVDVQIVYSQMTFDRRLYACGKGTFSMSDLEAGPWGARRTARRLARRCLWEGPRRLGPHVVEATWNT